MTVKTRGSNGHKQVLQQLTGDQVEYINQHPDNFGVWVYGALTGDKAPPETIDDGWEEDLAGQVEDNEYQISYADPVEAIALDVTVRDAPGLLELDGEDVIPDVLTLRLNLSSVPEQSVIQLYDDGDNSATGEPELVLRMFYVLKTEALGQRSAALTQYHCIPFTGDSSLLPEVTL